MLNEEIVEMTVKGVWFDGVTSAMIPATVEVLDGGQVVLRVQGRAPQSYAFDQLTISPRLGKTPRYIYMGEGGKFETSDNDPIDVWVKQYRGSVWDSLIHRWESQWHTVVASLAMVVFFGWAVVVYGLPAVSERIAFWLPDEVPQLVGEHALSTLDDAFFKASSLPEDEQQRVLDHFQPALNQYPDLPLRVLFRDGGAIGPNAFALPDGTLIFTDQMVALARDDDELLAVLAHEIGHVAERHSMQAVVRTSMLGFLIMAVTGDVSASSDVLLAVPLMMMELSHSRKFERQADDFSLRYMQAHDVNPESFVRIMSRLEGARVCMRPLKQGALFGSDDDSESKLEEGSAPDIDVERSAESNDANEHTFDEQAADVADAEKPASVVDSLHCFRTLSDYVEGGDDSEASSDDDWMDYLSSHPSTDERLEKFRQP